MSNEINTELLDRVGSAVDIAYDMAEYLTSTTGGNILDECIKNVLADVKANDLEDLQMSSLPILEEQIKLATPIIAEFAQDEMKAGDILC